MKFFNGQNPVITAAVIVLGTVNYYCTFLLTMLKRPYMVSCKPLAAPDSKPPDQRKLLLNIKWQVSGENGKSDEACSYYAREKECETS